MPDVALVEQVLDDRAAIENRVHLLSRVLHRHRLDERSGAGRDLAGLLDAVDRRADLASSPVRWPIFT